MQPSHPLYHAIQANCVDQARWVLADNPAAIYLKDAKLNLPLHFAARSADSKLVRMLASLAPLTATMTNIHGDTPLHIAAKYANVPAVNVLLDVDPSATARANMEGNTPLHCAATSIKVNSHAVFSKLFCADASQARRINCKQNTLLHCTAWSGNIQATDFLLASYPDMLYAVNAEGFMPVHVAVQQYLDAWNLASYRSTANMKNLCLGLHALLSHSHSRGYITNLRKLHAYCFAAEGAEGAPLSTMLHMACLLGHEDLALLLLSIDPSTALVAGVDYSLPIYCAADRGHVGILKRLLEVAPHLADKTNADMNTPLHGAAASGCGRSVAMLLQAAPHTAVAQNIENWTPTHFAAMFGNVEGLKLLLRNSPLTAEFHTVNQLAPIYFAVHNNNPDAVDLLMATAPHTAEEVDVRGLNVMHAAASRGMAQVVQILLRHAPAIALTTCYKGTAMHLALEPSLYDEAPALKRDEEACVIVKDLLEAAPSLASTPVPTWIGNRGEMPLHLAAALNMHQCVRELLRVAPSSNVTAQNEFGFTALDLALHNDAIASACELLRAPGQDAKTVLSSIHAFAHPVHGGHCDLIHTFLETYMPLSEDCWSTIPYNMPGLLPLLCVALARGRQLDTRQLIARMTPPNLNFVLCSLACMRAVAPCLPAELRLKILAASLM